MALAISNLSVKSILLALNVSSAKAIFYDGNNLRTISNFATIVDKNGLKAYCPGTTADQKLQNLLNDRKLSYFKGYDPIILSVNVDTELGLSYGTNGGTQYVQITSNTSWNCSDDQSWISTPVSGGFQNYSLPVTCTKNLSGQLRDGTLLISTVGGEINIYIPITQF